MTSMRQRDFNNSYVNSDSPSQTVYILKGYYVLILARLCKLFIHEICKLCQQHVTELRPLKVLNRMLC